MRGIILAAGRGCRMKALTDIKPKCLVKFRGKTLLDWQIQALKLAGISEIAIITGYKSNLIRSYASVEFNNPNWAATNMVSSLECADEWLNAGDCIVSYSDIYYQKSAIESLIQSKHDITITYDPNWKELWQSRFSDPLSDAETFKLSCSGSVEEIGNKPEKLEDIGGQYMGLLKITSTGWSEIQQIRATLNDSEHNSMHMTSLLQKVIDQNRIRVQAIEYLDPWMEFDSPSDLETADSLAGRYNV